jgi:hypothetical protein
MTITQGATVSTFDRQNLKKTLRLAFRISEHALERFRERVEEEFIHRSDDDLSDLLNARMANALRTGTVVDPRCPGAVTTLYKFECRDGSKLVAVTREQTVITVLDDWMARNNYSDWDNEGMGTTLGVVHGEKLRNITPVAASMIGALAQVTAPPEDEYLVLAAKCRTIAASLKVLREQRTLLDAQLSLVNQSIRDQDAELASKRDQLLKMMEGVTP